jgi:hypothetical protein
MTRRLEITPLTRIGELLDAYPELEDVLIREAPVFKKLKNPILRRTVAKVATVEKAASVAGIEVRRLVSDLRRAAGQSVAEPTESVAMAFDERAHRLSQPPTWLDESKVTATMDADSLLEAGEVPIGRIGQTARQLEENHVVLVTSTFRPVPLIEALEKQGFPVFMHQIGPDRFETFICRPSAPSETDRGD